MNHVLQAAARSVQLGWLPAAMTAVFIICFIAWTWWAFAAGNRERFEEAARLPLSEGDETE